MGAAGSSSEQAHTLIASGLGLADRADLLGALNHWELAAEFAPRLRAASLLVELTEAYLEARETGIALDPPDFRAHLSEIGYILSANGDPPGSRGGRGPSGSSSGRFSRDASQPPVPASSPPNGTWQGPPTAAAREPGRTVYGMPLHREDESSSPGSDLGGRPRYQAAVPPPPTHRRAPTTAQGARYSPTDSSGFDSQPSNRGPKSRQPLPGSRTSERARPGTPPSEQHDPWADLGSELAQVASGDWALPGVQKPSADSAVTRPPSAGKPRSAWDELEDLDAEPPPSRSSELDLDVVPADARLDDDVPDHLLDPFAVLDRGGLGVRPLTSPGVRFSGEHEATKPSRMPSPGRAATPTASPAVNTGRTAGTNPNLFDLFDDENLSVGDPFEGEPLLRPDLRSEAPAPKQPRIEVVVEPTEGDGGYDFELLDDDAGEVLTNPVYTPPHGAAVEEQPPHAETGELWERARHYHNLGDYSTAEKLLTDLLDIDPRDQRAERLLDDNRSQREKRYLSRLRSEAATPRIVLGQEQLVWQNLDAKKGFVLSRVDGQLTVQDIIDISNLPRHETIRILADLVDEGILAMT